MRFKVNENLAVEVKELLNSAGHNAETVPEEQLTGSGDPAIAEVCRREGRALITLDLDFADIRRYPPSEYPGIIVLRPHDQSRRGVLNLTKNLLPVLQSESLASTLWMVYESGVRIRTGA